MFSQQEEQKIVSYSKLRGYNDKPFHLMAELEIILLSLMIVLEPNSIV